MTWRIGSLFAGVGGIDLGLHAADVGETAWFSEYDKDASAVLAARFPGVPNHGDVTAIDWNAVEPVDVLVGGYPCQPFSFAGQRGGADDVRHLWPHFARALRVLRPRWAVLENVAGHLSLGFDAVLADLAEAGFDALWSTLRASDVGAPHRRERLFVVAGNAAGPRADSFAEGRASRCGPLQPGDVVAALTDDGGRHGWGTSEARATGRGDEARIGWAAGAGSDVAADASNERHERSGGARGWRGRPADDGGEAAADADWQGPQGAEPAGRRLLPARGGDTAADAAGPRRAGAQDSRTGRGHAGQDRSGRVEPQRGGTDSLWGAYAATIARWEHALGRAAPAPVDERGRLNAGFSEWMMGFPEGWVTDVLPRNPALRCIGNAVVPQVAAVVGAWLLEMAAREAVPA